MEGRGSKNLLNSFEGNDDYEQRNKETEDENDDMVAVAKRIQCLTAYTCRPETSKKGDELSCQNYGLWRQEQKNRAERLQKQLKAKWEVEQLIEEQLKTFHANYNCAMITTSFKDVTEFLMPTWAPPHELAALTWLGEWRPSAILDLVHGLLQSSSVLWPPAMKNLTTTKRLLAQFINEIRIEEAIIDAEMAEIQATCILHLPFSPFNNHRPRTIALRCVQAEFKKIERVITKAQQLRFKALEVGIKKALSQTDAAEFLVAFVGIQDLIHQVTAKQKLPHRPAAVPVKTLSHMRSYQA